MISDGSTVMNGLDCTLSRIKFWGTNGAAEIVIFCGGNTGWWLSPPLLKNMNVKWDDEIPNIWKSHVPNHQPDILLFQ